jgi:hypothetical protein
MQHGGIVQVLHIPEQHWPQLVGWLPLGKQHTMGAPVLHEPVQHVPVGGGQSVPGGLQVGVPHLPPLQVPPLQQSPLVWHGPFGGEH